MTMRHQQTCQLMRILRPTELGPFKPLTSGDSRGNSKVKVPFANNQAAADAISLFFHTFFKEIHLLSNFL